MSYQGFWEMEGCTVSRRMRHFSQATNPLRFRRLRSQGKQLFLQRRNICTVDQDLDGIHMPRRQVVQLLARIGDLNEHAALEG